MGDLERDIRFFHLALHFDTSYFTVTAVQRPYLTLSFDSLTWYQTEQGIDVSCADGLVSEGSEGPILNVFFEAGEEWLLGEHPISFDTVKTEFIDTDGQFLKLHGTDGHVRVGFWDDFVRGMGPGLLEFGSVKLGESRSLNVYIENGSIEPFVINGIISDHPDFTVYPTSLVVDTMDHGGFTATFSPSIVGTTSAIITVPWWWCMGKVIAIGEGHRDPLAVDQDHEGAADRSNGFVICQNYPNPFNSETQIRFELSRQTKLNLTVYNILGQAVEVLSDSELGAGFHSVVWCGGHLSSGIYYYRITAGDLSVTKEMILMR